MDVCGHADAQLLAGQAALARQSVALGEVGVGDVGLVYPDGVTQPDTVLVAGYRGEHAVPLLEGHLVGDTAQLGRALHGDVVAHGPDERDLGGKRLAVVLKDGASEEGEQPAAAAAPLRDAGGGRSVPPGATRAAFRTPRVRLVGCDGLGESAATPTSSRQRLSSAVRPATSA